jgi:hypothetical protein
MEQHGFLSKPFSQVMRSGHHDMTPKIFLYKCGTRLDQTVVCYDRGVLWYLFLLWKSAQLCLETMLEKKKSVSYP